MSGELNPVGYPVSQQLVESIQIVVNEMARLGLISGAGGGVWGTILGNIGDQADLSGILNTKAGTALFSNGANGLAPSSAGATAGMFLSYTGAWAVPAGAGDMSLAAVQTITGAKTFNDTKFKLAGATSGTLTVIAQAVAGANTVQMPLTGTLATLTGTENLSNKTLVAPVVSGIITDPDGALIVGTPIAGNVVDFAKGINTQTLNSAPTWTFGNSSTGQVTVVELTGDAVARVVTLPANVYSVGDQAVIANFTVPAGWKGLIYLRQLTGTPTWLMQGQPVQLSNRGFSRNFATGGNDTVVLSLRMPYAGTIIELSTKCDSGTATYTLQINGTNVTGGANAVSSAQVNNAPSALNVLAVNDLLTVVWSADAACVNARMSVKITPSKV